MRPALSPVLCDYLPKGAICSLPERFSKPSSVTDSQKLTQQTKMTSTDLTPHQYTPLPEPVPITEQNWSEDTVPLVSICCTAYNHEKFIRECLDGFLMQKTTFPVEILIHDDASTDGTADIIREYEAQYSQIIKPIYQTENQYSKGVQLSQTFNYPRSKGKYIALCEGDDYWTDPLKLQKQVDFLDKSLDYVLVADNSIWYNLFIDKKIKFSDLSERDLGVLEMLKKRQFGTASVLFRNLGTQLFLGDVSGDTILWCHLTKYGKLRYKENISSVYRRHAGGVTEGNKVEWAKKMIVWNNALSKNHPDINESIFKERNLDNFKGAINSLFSDGFYQKALLSIEELADLTSNPTWYKKKLFIHVEQLIIKKEKQLTESWSYKIGRFITFPARLAIQTSKKSVKLMYLIVNKLNYKSRR